MDSAAAAAPAPIRPLDDHLVNQIAAGEVIERPASVVKELVENAIDAGATRIDVELADGGIELITVTDDGCGIAAEQLEHAFRRHWTSKLGSAAELAAIASLGFRGEALASIAAVAEVVATSRTATARHAWSITIDGGTAGAPRAARGNRGTRIEVRRLFHRVPARRRFLKQPRTELLHVQRLIRQYAVARPDLAFSLDQPGARGLRLRAADDGGEARWRTLFGQGFLARAHAVDERTAGVTVRGWVGGPALATTQSELQYLALNGRVIRDRHLQHAIRLAYGDAVAPGRFPTYALALTMAPGAVDVNVHPAKLEVRFAELRTVHDVLLLAVRRALDHTAAGGAPASVAVAGPSAAHRPASGVAERTERYVPPVPAPVPRSGPDVAAAFGQVLAVVECRQLLFRRGDAVCLLDLERAWREVLERRLAGAAGASRPLLLPVRAALPSASRQQALSALGFAFEALGPAGGVLRAVPQVLPVLDGACLLAALDAQPADAPCASAVAAAAAHAACRASPGPGTRDALAALLAAAAAAGVDLDARVTRLTAAALARLDDAGE
ncbi:MAG: DNA mismatch repair endonuclease MutL [Gammaproteobacteria bacterium]